MSVTVSNTATTGLAAGYAFDEGAGTDGGGRLGTRPHRHAHQRSGAGAPARYGTAVNLDGVNDYVDLGNPAALQFTGSMTISAWINSCGVPRRRCGDRLEARWAIGFQLDTTVDRGPADHRLQADHQLRRRHVPLRRDRAAAEDLVPRRRRLRRGQRARCTCTSTGSSTTGRCVGTVTASQQNSPQNVKIGQRASGGFGFNGRIDDVRIYNRALTQAEIQADMTTPLGGPPSSDPTPPTVTITLAGEQRAGQRHRDRHRRRRPTTSASPACSSSSTASAPASRTRPRPTGCPGTRERSRTARTRLTARARDAAGNSTLSAPVAVNVANTNFFQNEILATGFNLPTSIKFLPDGRMLVVELQGTIKVLPPPYTQPDPTPFLQLTNIGSAGVQQGIYDIALDPELRDQSLLLRLLHAGDARTATACRGSPRTPSLTGTVAGQRARALPGSAGRQRRAPRRRDQLRQRRQALLHDGRALRRRGRRSS